jgi:glycosyltransferase 2 family protein
MKSLYKNHRKTLTLALVWLVVLGLLIWALRDVEFGLIRESLRQLRLVEILVLGGLNIGIVLLRGSRWWLILKAQGQDVPFFMISAYRMLAFSISYFTAGPQVGGEPAQVYLVQKRHRVPPSTAIASVSLEKILELLPNFAFLFFGVVVIASRGYLAGFSPGLVLFPVVGFSFLMLVYPVALWFEKTPLTWAIIRIPLDHPTFTRIQKMVASSERQMAYFCRYRTWTVVHTSLISLLMWTGIVIEFWLMARFVDIPFGPAEAVTALVFVLLAFLAPLPGGLGALEASQVFAMQSMGLDPSMGVTLSLLIRARDIAFGGAGLLMAGYLTQGLPVSALRRKNINHETAAEKGASR